MVLQPAMLPKRVPRLTRLQTRVVLPRVLRPSPLLPVTLLPSLLRLPNRMLLRRLQMALRMRLIRLPQPPPDRSMLQVTRMWQPGMMPVTSTAPAVASMMPTVASTAPTVTNMKATVTGMAPAVTATTPAATNTTSVTNDDGDDDDEDRDDETT